MNKFLFLGDLIIAIDKIISIEFDEKIRVYVSTYGGNTYFSYPVENKYKQYIIDNLK